MIHSSFHICGRYLGTSRCKSLLYLNFLFSIATRRYHLPEFEYESFQYEIRFDPLDLPYHFFHPTSRKGILFPVSLSGAWVPSINFWYLPPAEVSSVWLSYRRHQAFFNIGNRCLETRQLLFHLIAKIHYLHRSPPLIMSLTSPSMVPLPLKAMILLSIISRFRGITPSVRSLRIYRCVLYIF